MVLFSVLQHHLVFGRSVFFLLLIRVQADTQSFGVFSPYCCLLFVNFLLLYKPHFVKKRQVCTTGLVMFHVKLEEYPPRLFQKAEV